MILFYLAYVSGKRIKEAGGVSAITGYTIYMIGMAFFQFGTLLETNYPLEDNLGVPQEIFVEYPEYYKDFTSVYNISNYVYASSFVVFIILTEINLIKLTQFQYKFKN